MTKAAAPTGACFEHHTGGVPVLDTGTPAPRLSWYVPDAEPGFRQQSYEVEVTVRP